VNAEDLLQRVPRRTGKFEARNPKLERMSKDQKKANVPNKFVSDLSLDFSISTISTVEIVSDFDIRISNFDLRGEA
jgi:hypothetical protein